MNEISIDSQHLSQTKSKMPNHVTKEARYLKGEEENKLRLPISTNIFITKVKEKYPAKITETIIA